MSQSPTPAAPRSPARTADRPGRPAASSESWRRRRSRAKSSLYAAGEPMLWLTGGALALGGGMVVSLLLLVLWKGVVTFWPLPVVHVQTAEGPYMGEVTREDTYLPPADTERDSPELVRRRLVRTGNFRLTQTHFHWVSDFEIDAEANPEWALVVERVEWGRFYGLPQSFALVDFFEDLSDPTGSARDGIARIQSEGGVPRLVLERGDQFTLAPPEEIESVSGLVGVARIEEGAQKAWDLFQANHDEVRRRWHRRRRLEKVDTGEVNHRQEQARLALREAELDLEAGRGSVAAVDSAQQEYEKTRDWANQEFARIRDEIDEIDRTNAAFQLVMRTEGEGALEPAVTLIGLADIVRAYPANQLSLGGKLWVYASRWKEFLVDEPREANSEGGIFPAIFGTVAMTLLMAMAVVPFGVLAALYLREYAKAGVIVSVVRIAVNNLAGVPSIVFGVFGLGFFCYVVGASMDELLFASALPNPTYGKGGILWASLTLALLTLPVVIVATEEAVAAVPNSMREGSFACGASKWQTIQRIVLPRALPGIITGMILAIARGAGEVAPLMLVGAVKLAPELPVDRVFPFVHPERSFMHLGFHIYDVGFQSQNSEAAKPMVFTTTMLLIVLVASLNVAAIWLRSKLRKKFEGGQF